MRKQDLKYYCDNSFEKGDNEKWFLLMEMAFLKADHVMFNILRKDFKNIPEISVILSDLVEQHKVSRKLYASGSYLKFRLTDNIRHFVLSKNYSDWYNYFLEDISFVVGSVEFLATITHENCIVLLMTEEERAQINSRGFKFETEWCI